MDRGRFEEIKDYHGGFASGPVGEKWRCMEELITEVEASWAREVALRQERDALGIRLDDALARPKMG